MRRLQVAKQIFVWFKRFFSVFILLSIKKRRKFVKIRKTSEIIEAVNQLFSHKCLSSIYSTLYIGLKKFWVTLKMLINVW